MFVEGNFVLFLQNNNSKVDNGDKLSSSKQPALEMLPTVSELSSSSDHVITSSHDHTESDHVSSDNVTNTTAIDKQSSLVKMDSNQSGTPLVDDTNSLPCSITKDDNPSKGVVNVEQSSAPPTSGNGLFQQPVSDRMQYLTESCSYDNSDDGLILATPESQSVMEDEQAGLIATTNNNTASCLTEDPLVINDNKDQQSSTDEGNTLQDDVMAVSNNNSVTNVPQARLELHNRLQSIATKKFPELLTKINSLVKSVDDCNYDNDDHNLLTSIITDALDYNQLIKNL